MNFNEIYNNTGEQLKLKFLDAITRHNTGLQQEFLNFVDEGKKVPMGMAYGEFIQLVHNAQKEFITKFESIDLENPDWDIYVPPHGGYVEEWEAYQYASEQEIEEIFGQFESEAIDQILKQQVTELLASLIGMYEATQDAEIEDDIGTFEDVNGYLLDEHSQLITRLCEKIKLSAIQGVRIMNGMELFFEYCRKEYPGNAYFPNHFEYLLMVLAEKAGQPDVILEIINKARISHSFLPELVLMLNKESGNDTAWITNAENFYRKNNEVAKQLLEYYFDTDKIKFVEKARELFDTDKYYWAKFLESCISIEHDQELYIEVFRELAVREENTEYYSKIKKFIDHRAFEKLIAEIGEKSVFAVQLYSAEKQYERIKTIIEQDKFGWHFKEFISPILNIYPEYCFEKIREKAMQKIENERGRHAYEEIVSMMKLAQNIKGYESQTRELITKLYTYNYRLIALKDEFRKGGLV